MKGKKKKNALSFIENVEGDLEISESSLRSYQKVDYPLFSFRYLRDKSIDKCNEASFFFNFIMRLQKLSEIGWKTIRISDRHGYGMEKLPKAKIKHAGLLPSFVTPEAELHVFRASGDNRAFVGLQDDKIFHIFFIEANFGDIYDH